MGEGGRAGETWRDTIRTVCTYWTWRSVYKIYCYSTKLPCLLKLHFFHVYQEDVCKRKLEFNPFFRQDVGSKNKQDIFPLFSEERRTRDAGKKYIFLNDHWPPLEILDIFFIWMSSLPKNVFLWGTSVGGNQFTLIVINFVLRALAPKYLVFFTFEEHCLLTPTFTSRESRELKINPRNMMRFLKGLSTSNTPPPHFPQAMIW